MMNNDYINNRLADLKSDREQLQFWLYRVNKEIEELEDANRNGSVRHDRETDCYN